MKALSWNVHGLGSTVKQFIIKEVVHRHKIDILLIQETQIAVVTVTVVGSLWTLKDLLEVFFSIGTADSSV